MRRGGVKSFVDDLVLGRGVVISRAATSLRSVETQPLTRRFVRTRRATSPFSLERGLAVVLLGLLALLLMYIFFFLLSLSFLSLLFSSLILTSWRETGKPPAWPPGVVPALPFKLLANSLNGGAIPRFPPPLLR